MTWSWLSSWPVALVGLVSGVIGIGLFVWASVGWARERLREWRWERFRAGSDTSPFSSATTTTTSLEGLTRAYGKL
jgi:hypothetical protein